MATTYKIRTGPDRFALTQSFLGSDDVRFVFDDDRGNCIVEITALDRGLQDVPAELASGAHGHFYRFRGFATLGPVRAVSGWYRTTDRRGELVFEE